MKQSKLLLTIVKQCAVALLLCGWLTPIAAFAQTKTPARGVAVRKTNDKTLYAGSYALVIGVSDYTAGWDDLPGVAQDVAAVESALKAQGFEVRTTLNPKKTELTNQIQQFIDDYGFEFQNRLLIYYAGHGHTDTSADGRSFGFVVPADAPLPSVDKIGFERKAVDMRAIEGFAEQIRAKHALFVFDSCFSGKLLSRSEIRVPPYILDEVARPVRQFITAGAANQEVPDESVFRKVFVRALSGDADEDRDGYILGSELAKYLKREVTTHSNRTQTPQYGKILNLDLNQGDFVFVSARGASAAAVNNAPTVSVSNQAIANSTNTAAAEIETQFWQRIEKSREADDFGDYLQEYPKGRFAPLARQRLRELKRQNPKINENNSTPNSNGNSPIANNNASSGAANSAVKKTFNLTPGKLSYQGKFEYTSGITLPFVSISETKEVNGVWVVADGLTFTPAHLKSLPPAEQARMLAQLTIVNAVSLSKNTLQPLNHFYKDAQTSYDIAFQNDKATGTLTANGKTKTVNRSIGASAFGGGVLDAIGTLPLAVGYTTVWREFDAQTETVKTSDLRVAAIETIKTPAGEFETFKVLLVANDDSMRQTLWFGRSNNRLIKLVATSKDSGGITVTSELCNSACSNDSGK